MTNLRRWPFAVMATALIALAQPAFACTPCLSDRHDLSLSLGKNNRAHSEIYLRYEAPSALWAFRPVVGLSRSSAREVWAGAGLMLTWKRPDGPFFVQGSVMPGVYNEGGGINLGGSFQIRSSLEAGYELPSRLRVSIGVDHRSNANTKPFNPGMDGLHLRLSVPLR